MCRVVWDGAGGLGRLSNIAEYNGVNVFIQLFQPEPGYPNRMGFPLDLPVFFQSFTMGIWSSGISNTPLSRTVSLSPYSSNRPRLLANFITFRRNTGQHISGSASRHLLTRCILKADKCIDVFLVTKAKSNWLDLPLVNFRDQTITPKIWPQPRHLELFFDTLGSSR